MQERPHAMTEIDIASDQEQAERGGTAATDLQLECEERAMQALYDYQNAARTAREADRQSVPLPSLQIYSDLPREWPMARLAISNKQINRLVRTFLWRRVTEQALHGSSFVDIPDEINQAYIGDLLRISEAFAAPLSNLFCEEWASSMPLHHSQTTRPLCKPPLLAVWSPCLHRKVLFL